MDRLQPKVPEWARLAGLPCPAMHENFVHYVTRIGMNAEDLLAGLNENTMNVANHRLVVELMRVMPSHYEAYVEAQRGVRWPYRIPPA